MRGTVSLTQTADNGIATSSQPADGRPAGLQSIHSNPSAAQYSGILTVVTPRHSMNLATAERNEKHALSSVIQTTNSQLISSTTAVTQKSCGPAVPLTSDICTASHCTSGGIGFATLPANPVQCALRHGSPTNAEENQANQKNSLPGELPRLSHHGVASTQVFDGHPDCTKSSEGNTVGTRPVQNHADEAVSAQNLTTPVSSRISHTSVELSERSQTMATQAIQNSVGAVSSVESNAAVVKSEYGNLPPPAIYTVRLPPVQADKPTNQRLQRQACGENATVNTKFVLYVPESIGSILKVWLTFDKGGAALEDIEMFELPACKNVWQTDSLTMKEQCAYRYCMKYRGSTGFVGFMKSTFGRNEHKVEERPWRFTRKLSMHRDIYGPPIDAKTKEDGCKFFLSHMIEAIDSENDVLQSVNDFAEFFYCVKSVSFRELARYLTECAPKAASKPFHSFFIIYLLSEIIEHQRLRYSNIDKSNAKLLLDTLKSSVLKQSKLVYTDEAVDILSALTMIAEEKSDISPSWPGIICWCYPVLPASEIIRRINSGLWSRGDNSVIISRALKTLITYFDERKDAEELLVTCLNQLNSLEWHLEVYEELQQIGIQDSCLQEMFKNVHLALDYGVEQQLNGFRAARHLKSMALLVARLQKLYPHVMQKMAFIIENKIIQLLNLNEDLTAYCNDLSAMTDCSLLFNESESVKCLLKTCAGSRQMSQHQLFLQFAFNNKFLSVLQSVEMLEFVELWLNTAKILRTDLVVRADWTEWFRYTSQVLQLPSLVSDGGSKLKLNELFVPFASHYTRKLAESSNQPADLIIISTLVEQLREMDADSFSCVYRDLEDAITRVLRRADGYEAQHIALLTTLMQADRLFHVHDSALSVLERLTEARAYSVHEAFLNVLSGEKFWKILSVDDSCKLFVQWIDAAVNRHSKTKAKMVDSKKATDRSHIVHCYEYLAKVHQLEVPSDLSEFKEHVEIRVKNAFDELDAVAALDLLDTVSSCDETAKELLLKHISESKSCTLIPLRALQVRLNSIGQPNKKLDVSDRYVTAVECGSTVF